MKLNKNIKILRFGKYYINREGDFVIALLRGDKKHGYTFSASHANPAAWLGQIHTRSRTVPNDGNWIEVDMGAARLAAGCHITGHIVKMPEVTGNTLPIISKMYGQLV